MGGVEPPRGLMGQLHGIAIEADGRSRTDAGANWGDQRDRNRAVAFKIVATWDAADVRQRGMGERGRPLGPKPRKIGNCGNPCLRNRPGSAITKMATRLYPPLR